MTRLTRREFVIAGMAAAPVVALSSSASPAAEDLAGQVMTVAGPVRPEQLGVTLPHEHVLVDFIGAEKVSPDRYDRDEAFAVALPHLKRVRELGCETLVECTPAYIGRDPRLLKRLGEASGLRLVTNTGYYGAGQGKYLPRHAQRETADQLARRWIDEWQGGIDGTGVRPGFIKIGVDGGPLPGVNRTIVQAAARTHLRTGLTIAGHTGDGKAALEQIDVLAAEGVAAGAWIWVHAQSEPDAARHVEAAQRGAWVEFDGISPESIETHLKLVQNMQRHKRLDRTLISHDAGWYAVGEPQGGKFRSFETLFTQFLPALRKSGFSDDEVRQLTVTNPAKAFTLGVRRTG